MKKGYIVLVILLFVILGIGCLYYSKTELNWNEVDKLDFKEDEYSKLSLIVIGDKTYNYDFYEKNSQIGIRKKEDEIRYVTIGRPYWLSSLINDTRKEYPISKYKEYPGILVKDNYTKEVYFIRWGRDLANSLCEIIKDDDMRSTCAKYKDYNYKTDDFLEFASTRKELKVNKELIINNTTYFIQEDGLIYKLYNSNKKVIPHQVCDNSLDEYMIKAKEEATDNEESNIKIHENDVYYNLDINKESTKEILTYLSNINEINLEDFYKEENTDVIEQEPTYVDYNYRLDTECIAISDYYYMENTRIFVNNITIDDEILNFEYQLNSDDKNTRIFVNNKEIHFNDSIVPVISSICKYNKYFMYVQGWEGSPTFSFVNKKGELVHSFRGTIKNYENGILKVEEINRNNPTDLDDNTLEKYEIDTTNDLLTKNNLTTEPFPCEKEGPGYDC